MPALDFTVSVTQNTDTDLALNQPCQIGPVGIKAIAVYAPAAATSFEYGLFADDVEVFPRGTQPQGTAPSATPDAETKKPAMIADRQIRIPCRHAGAAPQTIRVRIDYETQQTDAEVAGLV